jgi:hypothetical protein
MFKLSIWRFEYWLVALILVLLSEDQNEINGSEVLASSVKERRKKRLSFSPVVQNESVGGNVSIANQTLLYYIASVNEKQITNNNSQTTKPKGDIYEIPHESTLVKVNGDHFTSGLHLADCSPSKSNQFQKTNISQLWDKQLVPFTGRQFSKGEIPWNIRNLYPAAEMPKKISTTKFQTTKFQKGATI